MSLEEKIHIINKKIYKIKNSSNVVVWGAGEHTSKLLEYTSLSELNLNAIVDKDRYGKYFWGKIIKRYEEINWEEVDAIVISSLQYQQQIYNFIKKQINFTGTIVSFYKDEKEPFYRITEDDRFKECDEIKSVIEANQKYKNMHKGERIFILCNGPSIGSQNLVPLKDEITISVSNFYHHKDNTVINPTYHCFPQITYSKRFTLQVAKKWLAEMGTMLGDAKLFVSTQEKELIEENNFFNDREVNYLYMKGEFTKDYIEPDITKRVPSVQSVPIMCIMIAIYMGAKEIYLLGTEHDFILKNEYKYFYNSTVLKGKDPHFNADGTVKMPIYESVCIIKRLWEQYYELKRIAESKGIKIFNATNGGMLDVFDRVKLEDVVSSK